MNHDEPVLETPEDVPNGSPHTPISPNWMHHWPGSTHYGSSSLNMMNTQHFTSLGSKEIVVLFLKSFLLHKYWQLLALLLDQCLRGNPPPVREQPREKHLETSAALQKVIWDEAGNWPNMAKQTTGNVKASYHNLGYSSSMLELVQTHAAHTPCLSSVPKRGPRDCTAGYTGEAWWHVGQANLIAKAQHSRNVSMTKSSRTCHSFKARLRSFAFFGLWPLGTLWLSIHVSLRPSIL